MDFGDDDHMETKNNLPVTNPKQALEKLMEGNNRFINGFRSVEPMLSHLKMAELADNGQKPFVIVLTCSDSRSPVEMIFDQGIGEVFVVRVAGNVVAPSLLASIEFAAANFGSCLILVMGHSQCGAIKASLGHTRNPTEALPSVHLEELVSRIRPAIEQTLAKSKNQDDATILANCTSENVKRSMKLIVDQSAIVRNLMSEGKLGIEGAVLDIRSGKVNLLNSH